MREFAEYTPKEVNAVLNPDMVIPDYAKPGAPKTRDGKNTITFYWEEVARVVHTTAETVGEKGEDYDHETGRIKFTIMDDEIFQNANPRKPVTAWLHFYPALVLDESPDKITKDQAEIKDRDSGVEWKDALGTKLWKHETSTKLVTGLMSAADMNGAQFLGFKSGAGQQVVMNAFAGIECRIGVSVKKDMDTGEVATPNVTFIGKRKPVSNY